TASSSFFNCTCASVTAFLSAGSIGGVVAAWMAVGVSQKSKAADKTNTVFMVKSPSGEVFPISLSIIAQRAGNFIRLLCGIVAGRILIWTRRRGVGWS